MIKVNGSTSYLIAERSILDYVVVLNASLDIICLYMYSMIGVNIYRTCKCDLLNLILLQNRGDNNKIKLWWRSKKSFFFFSDEKKDYDIRSDLWTKKTGQRWRNHGYVESILNCIILKTGVSEKRYRLVKKLKSVPAILDPEESHFSVEAKHL